MRRESHRSVPASHLVLARSFLSGAPCLFSNPTVPSRRLRSSSTSSVLDESSAIAWLIRIAWLVHLARVVAAAMSICSAPLMSMGSTPWLQFVELIASVMVRSLLDVVVAVADLRRAARACQALHSLLRQRLFQAAPLLRQRLFQLMHLMRGRLLHLHRSHHHRGSPRIRIPQVEV